VHVSATVWRLEIRCGKPDFCGVFCYLLSTSVKAGDTPDTCIRYMCPLHISVYSYKYPVFGDKNHVSATWIRSRPCSTLYYKSPIHGFCRPKTRWSSRYVYLSWSYLYKKHTYKTHNVARFLAILICSRNRCKTLIRLMHRNVPCGADSGVVRIDPLRFLAGCRTRRLNQV